MSAGEEESIEVDVELEVSCGPSARLAPDGEMIFTFVGDSAVALREANASLEVGEDEILWLGDVDDISLSLDRACQLWGIFRRLGESDEELCARAVERIELGPQSFESRRVAREESFDDWRRRTAALIEESQRRKA